MNPTPLRVLVVDDSALYRKVVRAVIEQLPNVEVIGLLPDSLQQITINAAGITSVAKEPDAARALIRHLTTPEALAIYKGKGLGL